MSLTKVDASRANAEIVASFCVPASVKPEIGEDAAICGALVPRNALNGAPILGV
jgi:hypothetical protein